MTLTFALELGVTEKQYFYSARQRPYFRLYQLGFWIQNNQFRYTYIRNAGVCYQTFSEPYILNTTTISVTSCILKFWRMQLADARQVTTEPEAYKMKNSLIT